MGVEDVYVTEGLLVVGVVSRTDTVDYLDVTV